METPKVSVVIATYNWSSVLRHAIRSVLDQTYRDFELLVVGDACTDDSEQVAASFGDPRIRWRNLPVNSGSQSGPNNAGLAMARGDRVAYLGHDDLWLPTHLASLVATMDRSGADLVHSLTLMLGPPENPIRHIAGVALGSSPDQFLREPVFAPPSSFMHRRALVDRIGPWGDYRTLRAPPDVEFLRRAWDDGGRFACTGRLSVLKFNSAWRRNSYLKRRDDEQAACARRMRQDPDSLERELAAALATYGADQQGLRELHSYRNEPGEIVRKYRVMRGLEQDSLAGMAASLATSSAKGWLRRMARAWTGRRSKNGLPLGSGL